MSRMVVFPDRSCVLPLSVYDVEGTCQKPWELQKHQSR